MSHKIVPVRYYLYNAVVLTILMVLTVAFAKMPQLHFSSNPNGINLAIALTIAILKAGCIVAIFMGSYWSTPFVRLLSVAGFAWLLIFFLFTFTDYMNPLAEFGTSYNDWESPGTNPLHGGQNHVTTGRELTPAHGSTYVEPANLHGHGAAHGGEHGAVEAHGAAESHGAETNTEPAHPEPAAAEHD